VADLNDNHADTIIAHLDALNRQIARQSSYSRMFVVGVCYGIGFVVGSALLATVLIGFAAPYLAQIPWVQSAFNIGSSVIHH